MKQKKILRLILSLRSLISVVYLNILVVYSKFKNKKIFFFYYPRKLVTGIHTHVIEDLFSDYQNNSTVIFGHEAHHLKLNGNYVYIKENFLKFILSVDIFISTALCDQFIKKSKKLYINHHIYDSPMVSPEKEKKMCERLSSYEIIFTASQNIDSLLLDVFKRYEANENINMPKLIEIGYPRFDVIQKKINKLNVVQKKNVIVSPTNIDQDPNFSLYNDIEKLLDNLINKTNFNVIFRPHPMNRFDTRILKIVDLYKKNKKFNYDDSDDYTNVFSNSFCMITDHSDIAYMFTFLTLCPVVFYSNKNLENFINSEQKKIKSYNYRSLNYFNNRGKIGLIINEVNTAADKINMLEKDYKKYENSIIPLRNEIKYLGQSKKRFYEEIKKLLY
tara:strand:+ start:675 stop:1841 length:1167 start_codon:yes stop_codon:yes gene_type:complete